mgnify:FL=1
MKKYFIVMILLIGVQSCRADSADGYEMKVLIEILDDLVEEMGVLGEQEVPPLPSILVFDNNNAIGYDTTEYKKKLDGIKTRDRNIGDSIWVIAVFDSLISCLNENLNIESVREQLPGRGYIEAFNAMKNPSITGQPLDLSKIGKREEFTLKYYSEFPEGFQIWERENYDFLFSGILEVSRIYFDRKRQFGLLYSSYVCDRLCGEGAIICIHKIDDKWVIDKKILLWVS